MDKSASNFGGSIEGVSPLESEVPELLRLIMRENSRALDELTSTIRGSPLRRPPPN
jgi:hypothetical protein